MPLLRSFGLIWFRELQRFRACGAGLLSCGSCIPWFKCLRGDVTREIFARNCGFPMKTGRFTAFNARRANFSGQNKTVIIRRETDKSHRGTFESQNDADDASRGSFNGQNGTASIRRETASGQSETADARRAIASVRRETVNGRRETAGLENGGSDVRWRKRLSKHLRRDAARERCVFKSAAASSYGG